jgi:hypothetical protein
MCVAMQNALHLSANEISLEKKTSHANVTFSRILCCLTVNNQAKNRYAAKYARDFCQAGT